MYTNTVVAIIYTFAGLGVLDTLYLSWHVITKKPVKCILFPVSWCKKVQYSHYSRTFGIPNPFLGFIMYAAILVLTYFSVAGAVPFLWVQLIIAIGFLFSLYFTIIQAFVLRAFCTWCVVSALNFLVMAVVALILI